MLENAATGVYTAVVAARSRKYSKQSGGNSALQRGGRHVVCAGQVVCRFTGLPSPLETTCHSSQGLYLPGSMKDETAVDPVCLILKSTQIPGSTQFGAFQESDAKTCRPNTE